MTGRIDASEIQQSLAELGIDISRENVLKILQRFEPGSSLTHKPATEAITCLFCVCVCGPSMDIDGTMMVDWNEWREHFLLYPAQNLQEIIRYWKHSSVRSHTYKHTQTHTNTQSLNKQRRNCRGIGHRLLFLLAWIS